MHLVFGYNRTLGIILILDSCHMRLEALPIPLMDIQIIAPGSI